MSAAALAADEFDFIAGFLKQRSGLALTHDKMYLIESRLQPIARAQGMESIAELVRRIRTNGVAPAVITEVTEAMTTNESSFFRDTKPFEYFTKLLIPRLRETNPGMTRLRVWSSACSTGQEPYSTAIAFREEGMRLPGLSCEIFCTDINDKVIERAKEGKYSQFEVQRGLPIMLLMKYFTQLPENQWQVQDSLKQMMRFQNVNLLAPFVGFGPFEVIFCRNVLIYFDEKTKSDVLDRMADMLIPGGFLILGSAESVYGLSKRFTPLEEARGVFIKA